MYCVYVIENTINNKKYIGITKNFEKRSNTHKRCIGNCKKLYNAIKKYGWNKFSYKKIKVGSKEDVLNLEIEYIKKYDSINSGYNILPGGNLSRTGINCSEEHKKRIGQANKNYKATTNTKKKLSKSMKKAWKEGKFKESVKKRSQSKKYKDVQRELAKNNQWRAENYKITLPDNETLIIKNLAKFSRENIYGYKYDYLKKIMRGAFVPGEKSLYYKLKVEKI